MLFTMNVLYYIHVVYMETCYLIIIFLGESYVF